MYLYFASVLLEVAREIITELRLGTSVANQGVRVYLISLNIERDATPTS